MYIVHICRVIQFIEPSGAVCRVKFNLTKNSYGKLGAET